jgi:hypothetical protein
VFRLINRIASLLGRHHSDWLNAESSDPSRGSKNLKLTSRLCRRIMPTFFDGSASLAMVLATTRHNSEVGIMGQLVQKCCAVFFRRYEQIAGRHRHSIGRAAVESLRSCVLTLGRIWHRGDDSLRCFDRIVLVRLDPSGVCRARLAGGRTVPSFLRWRLPLRKRGGDVSQFAPSD